jgi:hypothetical protein
MLPNFDAQALFEVDELEANQWGLVSYDYLCMCCHGAKNFIA